MKDDGPEQDQHAADDPVRPAFHGIGQKRKAERYKPEHDQEDETMPSAPRKTEPEGQTSIRFPGNDSGHGRHVVRLERVPDAGQQTAHQPQEDAQVHGAFPSPRDFGGL